jgi:hypothetical protein
MIENHGGLLNRYIYQVRSCLPFQETATRKSTQRVWLDGSTVHDFSRSHTLRWQDANPPGRSKIAKSPPGSRTTTHATEKDLLPYRVLPYSIQPTS